MNNKLLKPSASFKLLADGFSSIRFNFEKLAATIR